MAVGADYKKLFNHEKEELNLISGIDLIVRELELLLNFPRYSLFFGNNMGLDLEKYLYLSNRRAIFNLIADDIKKFFNTYGRVNLTSLEMSFDDINSKIIIDIEVGLGNETRTITLERG